MWESALKHECALYTAKYGILFLLFLAHNSPNPWNFLSDKSDKGVLMFITSPFRVQLRNGLVIVVELHTVGAHKHLAAPPPLLEHLPSALAWVLGLENLD